MSCVALLIGFVGTQKVKTIALADSAMYTSDTKPLGNMANILANFQKMRNKIKDVTIARFVLNTDPDKYIDEIKALDKQVQDELTIFEKSIRAENVRKEYETMKSTLNRYYTTRDKALALALEGKKDDALSWLYGEGVNSAGEADRAMKNLFDSKIDAAKLRADENTSIAEGAIAYTWIFAVGGTLLAIMLGIYLAFSITKPINRVVKGLNEAADQVATASSQVSSASQQLAAGSSEQAASIEETSSSLEEMSSMTKLNADHASHANGLMAETNSVVSRANDSMIELTTSMAEITRTSEETSKIIKTIDEIAFQTNLLALNAAVEAARAGEAGAGFAVVADEVRNLAMRAAEAARNTTELIEGALKQIKDGSEMAEKTSSEFNQVSVISSKMSELVGEIAEASKEQAQGIEQINRAVAEMDKIVQQNAANAEESASASEEMNAQAAQMKNFVEGLTAIVGGASNQAAAVTTTGRWGSIEAKASSRMPKKINIAPSKPPVEPPAARTAPARETRSAAVKPESVIPFNDEDSLAEF